MISLSTDIIDKVQRVLGCVLPEPLLDLYQASNSTIEYDDCVEMRLMSLDEVIEFHKEVWEEEWGNFKAKGIRVFWTDDNSNFTGLYVAGLLEGKLCFIDHEEVNLSPVYTSVQSFTDAMTAASLEKLGWPEFRRDYPSGPSVDHYIALRDWEISQAFRCLYEASQDEDRVYYAFCMMALTPCENIDSLLACTYDMNMHIQAKACELLGQRRYEPATDRLAEVAQHGTHNGQIASIIALGQIGSASARLYLHKLFSILPRGYDIYINAALRENA